MTQPDIVAHRGGAGLWAENSLTAFREVRALPVDQVEMDVHLTADGELAVIHDPVMERTTTGRGAVGDKTRAELAGTHLIGVAEGVPFLDEVLRLYEGSPLRLQIEIKVDKDGRRYPGIEERVVETLRRHGVGARALLGGFQPDTLAAVRALASDWPLTGYIGSTSARRAGGLIRAVEGMAAAGAGTVGLQHSIVTDDTLAAIRRLGLRVGVWTVNEAEGLDYWVRQPVDFITTDRPDLALAARARAAGK